MGKVRFHGFRVYAGEKWDRGLYVEARIFATKREMLTAIRAETDALGGRGYSNRTEGCMQSFKATKYNARGQWRTSACIGRVNLYRRGIDTEVVVHEFGHAMFAWGERKNLLAKAAERHNDLTAEEQLCYVLGRMVNRFFYHAGRLKLYP